MIRAFQRHCNFSSQSANKPRPEWFNREKIFDSFISTLDDRVDYTAFHDSGNGGIEDHFLNKKDVNKVSKFGGNDAQSFLNLLNYVIEQDYKEEDLIYFVEDDYLHKEGWVDILLEGFDKIRIHCDLCQETGTHLSTPRKARLKIRKRNRSRTVSKREHVFVIGG